MTYKQNLSRGSIISVKSPCFQFIVGKDIRFLNMERTWNEHLCSRVFPLDCRFIRDSVNKKVFKVQKALGVLVVMDVRCSGMFLLDWRFGAENLGSGCSKLGKCLLFLNMEWTWNEHSMFMNMEWTFHVHEHGVNMERTWSEHGPNTERTFVFTGVPVRL